jgi:hypothetical protein
MRHEVFWRAMVVMGLMAGCVLAAEEPGKPATAPAQAPAEQKPKGLTLNLAEKYLDVDATVCLTEGPLELLATVPAGKEHESVFVMKARAPHVHAYLLALGIKEGRPGKWTYENKVPKPIDPTGDHVLITVLYQKDGKTVERPIGDFARDRKTGKTLSPSEFVFAGSQISRPKDEQPFYAAEVSGDVLALVSFDDEMLAYPKAASSSNDELEWEANTKEIPPVGTAVKLRMRPVAKAGAASGAGEKK